MIVYLGKYLNIILNYQIFFKKSPEQKNSGTALGYRKTGEQKKNMTKILKICVTSQKNIR